MKVTLHEVAARADVSIATVSRAINGLPVSKQSLARVQKAVADLGYVANEAARALRSDRTLTMGLIFSDLRNTLGIELLDALSESIEDAGYSLLISTARGDAARYDLLMHRFLERRVDALFCLRPPATGESLARYQAAQIPVLAMFEAGGAFADLPIVRPVFNEPGKALADHLHEGGHKRIAVIRPEGRSPAIAAIVESLKAQDLHVEIIESSESEGTSGVVAAAMAKRFPATAIVAPDPLVRGLIASYKAAGVRIPEDVSVISVNDLGAEGYHKKHGTTSVCIDPHRMGRAAGTSMLAWLAGSRPAAKIRVQTAYFVARSSSGPARKTR